MHIVVHSLSHVWLFAIPWTVARQASLPFSISWRLLKLMSVESWCHPTILYSVIPYSSCPHLSQCQGLLQWLGSLHQQRVASVKVLELQLQHQSFHSGLISFRTDWFNLLIIQGSLKSLSVPQFESINSLLFSILYSPTLTSLHDYWKNYSFY